MRIGVLGINHKLANLKLRELLAKACHKCFGSDITRLENQPFVLLSTCNRTEVYFYSDDLAATHTFLLNTLRNEVEEDFDQKLYSYFGQDCLHHLSRVTSGLDSAVVAETEIQGQVKNAYESSVQFCQLPEEMHYLFQKALKIGKKVRSTYLLKSGLPEIEHAIYNTGNHLFKNQISTIKILFIGVSDINQKILHFLKSKNLHDITICNRTEKSARSMANNFQLNVLEWQKRAEWAAYDWIICGTRSPHYLIDPKNLSADIGSKLIIDLSVPRNVDPVLARHSKVTLLNIDQINRMLAFRKQKMVHALTQGEEYVLEASKHQALLFLQKQQNRQRLLAVGA